MCMSMSQCVLPFLERGTMLLHFLCFQGQQMIFKGLLHCFFTFSRLIPDKQIFMRKTDY